VGLTRHILCEFVSEIILVFFAKNSAKCGSFLLLKHKVVPKSKFNPKYGGFMLTTRLRRTLASGAPPSTAWLRRSPLNTLVPPLARL
jgi:hypothetical protein